MKRPTRKWTLISGVQRMLQYCNNPNSKYSWSPFSRGGLHQLSTKTTRLC
uniref:Uncharacterized protein n=1 Tax=Anguilla anguilla TaxID=7936 RepID=A0A0E9TZM8_ANGAN